MSAGHDVQWDCHRKKAYPTREEARRALHRLARGSALPATRYKVYICPYGDHAHVAHNVNRKPRKPSRGKTRR